MKQKNKKNKIYFIIIILVLLSIGIGYSILTTTLSIEGNIAVSGKSLYENIAKQAVLDDQASTYVTSSTGIDFSKAPSDTNGKGVYKLSSTKDDEFPVYYYRGNVTNNNVLFANFCWRIVRTTETGGIKLIYNGTPSDGGCASTSSSVIIATSAFNTEATTPAYAGYMYGNVYKNNYYEMGEDEGANIYYGTSITISNPSTLGGDIYHSSNTWKNYYQNLTENGYYTCNRTSQYCSNGLDGVWYIYNISETGFNYIEESLADDIINPMTYKSSNTNDSQIKKVIDNWYQENLNDYTSKLENTVWCNDRGIYSKTGWTVNAEDFYGAIYFNPNNRSKTSNPSLACSYSSNKFTVSDTTTTGNGKLTYPIALLTADEVTLAGNGYYGYSYSTYLANSTTPWWTMSPSDFDTDGSELVKAFSVGSTLNRDSVTTENRGVRPSISLNANTKISSGDGTADNPYTIA